MEIREITSTEFEQIKKDELEIFRQLEDREIFKVDDRGDLVFSEGEGERPIIIGYNVASPLILQKSNMFHVLNGKSNLIDATAKDGFTDVFDIDDQISSGRREPAHTLKLIGAFINGTYQGCVWTYANEKYVSIYGIRSSILNHIMSVR